MILGVDSECKGLQRGERQRNGSPQRISRWGGWAVGDKQEVQCHKMQGKCIFQEVDKYVKPI